MSATMVMEMIMPAPVETQIEMPDESRDTRISESMPTSDKVEEKCCNVMTVEEEDTCDKGQQNTVQKLLAESTAAIAKLSTHQPNSTGNQEDELVSTPSRTTGVSEEEEENVQQRLAPRASPYPGVSQILPSLFLCSAAAARVNILEHLKISLVINLAPELIVDTPLPSPKPIYLRVPVLDKGHVDLKQYFDETCDLMEDVRQSGGKTLIHCVAGVSRSAAICIAYLIKYEKMSLKDAYKHVKWARPQIRPNCGFFRQLMSYEMELTGKQTVHFVMLESIGQEVPDVYEPEYKAMEQFYQRHRHRHVRKRD